MRRTILTCLVAIGALCAPEALAGTRVVVQTRTYDITGGSGFSNTSVRGHVARGPARPC